MCEPAIARDLAGLLVNSEANHYATPPAELSTVQRYHTEHLPDADAIMDDFHSLAIDMRQEAEIQTSTSALNTFEKNSLAIRIVTRMDVALLRANHFVHLAGITT